MNTSKLTAFALAALTTLALFGGVDGLATRPHAELELARATPAPVASAASEAPQVIVITGRRQPRA